MIGDELAGYILASHDIALDFLVAIMLRQSCLPHRAEGTIPTRQDLCRLHDTQYHLGRTSAKSISPRACLQFTFSLEAFLGVCFPAAWSRRLHPARLAPS